MAFDNWGRQQYPTGWLTRGSIKRGGAPGGGRFQAPNAGISPSISGDRSPIIHTMGVGDAIRAGANAYVDATIENERQQYHQARLAQIQAHQQSTQAAKTQAAAVAARQAKRKAGIKYAKAKSRVYKRGVAAAAAAGPATPTVAIPPTPSSWLLPGSPGATPPLPPPTPTIPMTPSSWAVPPAPSTGSSSPWGSPSSATPPPPPPSVWDTPPDTSFRHGIIPDHLIPPAPGTRAWNKQQAQEAKEQAALKKQRDASMPPPPPTASPWGPPTLLTPPPAPTVAQPAKTRSNGRSTKKATTPSVTAPQVVGALTPVENLTQTPPNEATPAPDLTPAPKKTASRSNKKATATTPAPEAPVAQPAKTRSNSRKATPALTPAPVAPAGPPPVPKGPVSFQINPDTGQREAGETHNGQWYSASHLRKHGRPQPQ